MREDAAASWDFGLDAGYHARVASACGRARSSAPAGAGHWHRQASSVGNGALTYQDGLTDGRRA